MRDYSVMIHLVLALDIWGKGSYASSVRRPVLDEERMRLGPRVGSGEHCGLDAFVGFGAMYTFDSFTSYASPLILFSSLSIRLPVRIDLLHFLAGSRKRRSNLGFFSCFSLFYSGLQKPLPLVPKGSLLGQVFFFYLEIHSFICSTR